MSEQTAPQDSVNDAVNDNRPDGSGLRPPGSNQRAAEPPTPGSTDEAAPVDSTNPATPPLPATGAHRPSAPSGEVAPS